MVFHIVKNAAKRAGIEGNASQHWLRPSHASHSLDRGAPIHLLQKTLGHSSVAITEMYLHARPTDSRGLYLPLGMSRADIFVNAEFSSKMRYTQVGDRAYQHNSKD